MGGQCDESGEFETAPAYWVIYCKCGGKTRTEIKGGTAFSGNTKYVEALALHEEDYKKFKRPGDAKLMFQMLMMLAQGMAVRLENGADYDGIMKEFEEILNMLKYNFYKEEYLP